MPSVSKEERERRQTLVPELVRRYLDGEGVDQLAQDPKVRMTEKSIYYYLSKAGVGRQQKKKKDEQILKEVSKQVQEDLSSQGTKLATISLAIGGVIANRYLPIIDAMMADGWTLEYIAEQLMNWWEMKETIELRLNELEIANRMLDIHLNNAYEMAHPNFVSLLKIRTLERFAGKVLQYRSMGLKIPTKSLIRTFNNDLNNIDQSLEAFKETLQEVA